MGKNKGNSTGQRLVLGGVAVAMLVAGCNTGTDDTGDPAVPTVTGSGVASPSTAPPAATTESPSPSPSPAKPAEPTRTTPAAPAKPDPVRNPQECQADELDLSIGGGDAAAGTTYRELRFTNSGDRVCLIQGFPGVSYVTGDDGHQVGPAAYRVGKKGPAISLAPGETAFAPVGFVQVRNYDPAVCEPTEVRGLRVYPPHEYDALYLPEPGLGCAGTPPGHQLTVRTIQR